MTGPADVLAGPAGRHIAAFFDFDGTLIDGSSGFIFFRERLRRGEVSPLELARSAMAGLGIGRRAADVTRLHLMIRAWRGRPEQEIVDLGERLFRLRIAGRVRPQARALVRAHQRRGHTVVLASSATPYQVAPLVEDLELGHVLCTRPEVAGGVLTGRIAGPICWGPAKAAAVRRFAAEQGIELADCYGYGDSDGDLPFLAEVGQPRVLNPKPRVARVAAARGWPVHRLPGRPGIGSAARTAAALVSIGAAVAGAVGVGLLTGSRRLPGQLLARFGPGAVLAVAGVGLDVVGGEHLWLHRPAVFVFNHQSALDVLLVGRLLRRDFTALVKNELAHNPVFAPLGALVGVAYVERGNRAQTTSALEPVLHRLAAGVSVAVAPEGTRSVTPRPGPFKKGAFHLAVQAGVPVVPIVICNAGDLLWKRSLLVRSGTVQVVVLPPVSTAGWSVQRLDEHVRELRQRFLDTLAGNPPAGD